MSLQYRAPDSAIRLWYPAPALPTAGSREPQARRAARRPVPRGRIRKRIMRKLFVWMVGATVLATTAGTASAQYGPQTPGVSSGVTGADYHVELSYSLWRPS